MRLSWKAVLLWAGVQRLAHSIQILGVARWLTRPSTRLLLEVCAGRLCHCLTSVNDAARSLKVSPFLVVRLLLVEGNGVGILVCLRSIGKQGPERGMPRASCSPSRALMVSGQTIRRACLIKVEDIVLVAAP